MSAPRVPGRGARLEPARLAAALAAVLVAVGSVLFLSRADPVLEGDEPHYLVYANSLRHGWGVDLTRGYDEASRAWIVTGPLPPHGDRYRGPEHLLASWHGIGLPLLLAPVLALHASIWWARRALVAFSVLLAYHLARLVQRLVPARPALAAAVAALVVLSPPVVLYAGQLYPEVPAALLVVLCLRALLAPAQGARTRAGAAVAAGLLPWLGFRYGLLAAPLLLVLGLRVVAGRWRGRATPWAALGRDLVPAVLPAVVLLGGVLAFNYALYGGPSPTEVWDDVDLGAGGFFLASNLYRYGVGDLIGARAGALVLGPVLLAGVALLGLAVRRLGVVVVGAALLVALPYYGYTTWFGSQGFCPPGRYTICVIALLAVPLAVGAAHLGRVGRAAIAVLAVLSLLATWEAGGDLFSLYRNDVRQLRVVQATSAWWPAVLDPPTSEGVGGDAPALGHEVGQLEQVGDAAAVVGRPGRDPAGALALAPPQLPLRPGEYVASAVLVQVPGAAPGTPPGAARITVDDDREPLVAPQPLVTATAEGATAQVAFRVVASRWVAVRVAWDGAGVVGVRSLEVRPVHLDALRRPAAERWKAVAWALVLAGAGAAAVLADRRRAGRVSGGARPGS